MYNCGYAIRTQHLYYYIDEDGNKKKKQEKISMHRLINKTGKLEICDHINHNTIDNRKENLRNCTKQENNMNVAQNRKNNTSGYKGVFWHNRDQTYEASIRYMDKQIYLGRSLDIKECARIYNEAALKYFGEFALLNIID
jgi:hypothetical protein